MDKTYCIIRSPGCHITFEGVDAEKYTAIWNELKNEKYNKRMPIINHFEEKLAAVQAELKPLKDDRTFWQKLFKVETETSKRIAELQNEACCVLDDIFDLQTSAKLTVYELCEKLWPFLGAEDFNKTTRCESMEIWTKVHK